MAVGGSKAELLGSKGYGSRIPISCKVFMRYGTGGWFKHSYCINFVSWLPLSYPASTQAELSKLMSWKALPMLPIICSSS